MGFFDLQLAPQAQKILDEERDGVRRLARLAAALPAQVVAQHAEIARERRNLRLPHRRVVGDAGDESDPRAALAVDPVIDTRRLHLLIGGSTTCTSARRPFSIDSRPRFSAARTSAGFSTRSPPPPNA